MTLETFRDFPCILDATIGALGRKALLFADNCVAHSPDTFSLRNVKVVLSHELYQYMLGGSLVTTAWRVLKSRKEETTSRYGR
jgi:hypothetical protein